MSEIKLDMPFDKSELKKLRAGDNVLLSGEMFVFRDAGHKRLFASIEKGNPDIGFAGETVYFMGPCPAQKDQIMGSCGPTTSCRMDKYTPYMFDHGLAAQIGKGKRSLECIEAFKRNGGDWRRGRAVQQMRYRRKGDLLLRPRNRGDKKDNRKRLPRRSRDRQRGQQRL